ARLAAAFFAQQTQETRGRDETQLFEAPLDTPLLDTIGEPFGKHFDFVFDRVGTGFRLALPSTGVAVGAAAGIGEQIVAVRPASRVGKIRDFLQSAAKS